MNQTFLLNSLYPHKNFQKEQNMPLYLNPKGFSEFGGQNKQQNFSMIQNRKILLEMKRKEDEK